MLIYIPGTKFDTTAANNLVAFTLGAVGTCIAATATLLTVNITTKPTAPGELKARVTNGNGTSAQVKVANIVVPALAGHWPLNEGTGTTAGNVSGNGNDLTLGFFNSAGATAGWDADTPGSQAGAGGCIYATGGPIAAGAVNFDGTAVCPQANATRTLAFWFKFTDTRNLVQFLTSAGVEDTHYAAFRRGQYAIGTDFTVFTDGDGNALTTAIPAPTDGWHHFAITWDGKWLKHYQDGVLLDSIAAGPLLTTGNLISGILAGLATQTAKMKDLRLYNCDLTPTMIAALAGV